MTNFFKSLPKRIYKKAKSWHKYLGLLLSVFLIWMSISGIILNHPDWFSDCSVPKSLIPEEYYPQNWNRGAVSDAEFIGTDTIFFAGREGIWRSLDAGKTFTNEKERGFTTSRYYQKTSNLILLEDKNQLLASTFGGIWLLDLKTNQWSQADFGKYTNDRFVKVLQVKDKILAFSKSNVYQSNINNPLAFQQVEMKRTSRPYMDLVMFFFALHSGWLWGLPGKLIYDIAAIILVFLSATALYITFRKKSIQKNKQKGIKKNTKWFAFSIKHHAKIGFWMLGFLLIFGGTGLFMRPPLFIALMGGEVPEKYIPSPIANNPWYHSIRNVMYDPYKERLILDTTEGLFEGKADLSEEFEPTAWAVNIFVMGATVFEALPYDYFLVGSFSGLFAYQEGNMYAKDLISGEFISPFSNGRPAEYMAMGYFQRPDGEAFVNTYNQGLLNIDKNGEQPYEMPSAMNEEYRMSLWNYMFELHNGRLFGFLLGKWNILFIPITALLFLILNVTGTYEYLYRNRKKVKQVFQRKKK